MIFDIRIIITRPSKQVLLVPYVYFCTKNIYSVLPVTDYHTLANVHSGKNNAPSFNILFCGKEYHISSHEISLRY